jgi:hypothetical protein
MEGLARRGIYRYVPMSRGNDDAIAFLCFDENNIIESICLEEEMGDAIQDFV